jgi:hypothetical protein
MNKKSFIFVVNNMYDPSLKSKTEGVVKYTVDLDKIKKLEREDHVEDFEIETLIGSFDKYHPVNELYKAEITEYDPRWEIAVKIFGDESYAEKHSKPEELSQDLSPGGYFTI